MADSFKESADKIINELELTENYKHPDMYFIPIAYLYRHALELKLKQLINMSLKLELIYKSEKVLEALKNHSLAPLWHQVKLSLKKRWPTSPGDDLRAVERVILDFHSIDRSGQSLRYTKKTNGESTLLSLPKAVDLRMLKDVFGRSYNLLDGCQMTFEHDWEVRCEMEGYYRG